MGTVMLPIFKVPRRLSEPVVLTLMDPFVPPCEGIGICPPFGVNVAGPSRQEENGLNVMPLDDCDGGACTMLSGDWGWPGPGVCAQLFAASCAFFITGGAFSVASGA